MMQLPPAMASQLPETLPHVTEDDTLVCLSAALPSTTSGSLLNPPALLLKEVMLRASQPEMLLRPSMPQPEVLLQSLTQQLDRAQQTFLPQTHVVLQPSVQQQDVAPQLSLPQADVVPQPSASS